MRGNVYMHAFVDEVSRWLSSAPGPVTGGDTRDKVTGPGAWGGPEGLKTRENAKNCANRRVEIGPPGGPYEIPKGHWGPHGPLTDPPEPTWAPQRLL